eukprot:TRINITY_DN14399_c0_g4_i1.p1 TRINITY_DN14399_c0_g4~~TRINITY_DN14399_c0_g4_i1.p1  ORF type:complete len:632 (-),score=170.94 TRINITY_DN14399_c0_g4_i1:254-2149(-)
MSFMLAEEASESMGVAIAGTLLGAVSFNLILFYLINHSDPDMRKYSYEVINGTVSIFAAVLIFQTFNDLVETYIFHKREGEEEGSVSKEFESVVDFAHMLIWFIILQLSLATISGAIGSPPKNISKMELNMKSIAQLLAHLTGFASINAWGSLQQLDVFKASPLMSFAVVPISCFGQFLLQRITSKIRTWVSLSDDKSIDEFERAWEEETQEAENDVMGLTLSFNLTQASRFALTGFLPNQEGKVPRSVMIRTNNADVLKLYGVGLISVSIMVVLFMRTRHGHHHGEHEHDSKTEPLLAGLEAGESNAVVAHGHGGHGEGEKKEGESEEEEEEEDLVERMQEALIITFSMGFAWCMFFGTRGFFASNPLLSDGMLQAVVLTMVISFCSFACIRLLDILADMDCTGDTTDEAIKQTIKAISILVGFAWEQCFDEAVGVLASATPEPHAAKMLLALFCVIIIVPAWRLYLLPMALKDGWKFGFVVDEEEIEEKFASIQSHLLEKQKSRQEGIFSNVLSAADREELLRLRGETQDLRKSNEQLESELTKLRTSSAAAASPPCRTAIAGGTAPTPNGVAAGGAANGVPQRSAYTTPQRRPLTSQIHAQIDTLEQLTQSLVGAFEKGTSPSKASPN